MTTVSNTKTKRQEFFRKAVKMRLIDLDLSIADLARRIGRPRPTVSSAINQGRFAPTQKLIADELGLHL